jgi:hypothetical protein
MFQRGAEFVRQVAVADEDHSDHRRLPRFLASTERNASD